jgi:predicted P-loop ATPase
MAAPIISIYTKAKDVDSQKTIPLDIFLEYIRDGKWQDIVLPIRAMSGERKDEKKRMAPCVTIGGQFTKRNDAGLTSHSGYISIDIDNSDPEETKSILAPDPYIHAIFTSISGTGVCAIFRIDGKRHRDAFAGISEYLFTNYNIVIDPTSVNVSRARFVSFDPHIYIAPKCEKFALYPTSKPPKKIDRVIYAQTDFDELVQEIIRRRLNLCENYHEWLRIGFALADKFGASGEDYYHLLSQFSSKYNPDTTARQYKNCLKAQGGKQATIATLYYYVKQAGLQIYSQQTKIIAHAASHAKKGGRTQQQAVENIQKFEDIPPEQSTDIVAQVYENDVDLSGEDSELQQIEQWLRHNYEFRRNGITRYIETDKILKQKDFNTIFIAAKKVFSKITYELMERIINSDFTQDYNPITDFLMRHQERGPKGQIDALFNCISTDDPVTLRLFGKKWLVSIMSAIHGVHSPLMLVLSGEVQGTGKTEFLRRLLPSELRSYYAESKLDAGKDDEILMTQKLIIMDDEMGGKSKKDERRLKELLSRQTFSLREPYGRNNVDLDRLAVLCGTTNDRQILSDPTGNRRIIPIYVNAIDHKVYNSIDKIDVFIEAYHLFKSGFDWQLTKDEINILSLHGDGFQNYSVEYELISKYYEPGDSIWMTATDIKVELERFSQQKLSLDRLGKEMHRLGYEQKSKRDGDVAKKKYGVNPLFVKQKEPFS